MQCFRLMLF